MAGLVVCLFARFQEWRDKRELASKQRVRSFVFVFFFLFFFVNVFSHQYCCRLSIFRGEVRMQLQERWRQVLMNRRISSQSKTYPDISALVDFQNNYYFLIIKISCEILLPALLVISY